MGKFNFDNETISLIQRIQNYPNFKNICNRLSKEYPNRFEECVTSISKALNEKFACDMNDATYQNFVTLYSFTCMFAFLEYLDNDKNVTKFMLNLKEQNIIIDGQFGFDGLLQILRPAIEVLQNKAITENNVEGGITSMLLSSFRTISIEDYLDNNKYVDDLYLMSCVYLPNEVELYDKILQYIEDDTNYCTYFNSSVESILGVYKYLFQDSFGLNPYDGILSVTGNNDYYQIDDTTNKLKKSKTLDMITKNCFTKIYDIEISNKRQFDIKEIITSDKTYYYPSKMIEYAMGKMVTTELDKEIYKPYAKTDSWDIYEKEYVRPQQIERFVKEVIYYTCELFFPVTKLNKEKGTNFSKNNFSFADKDFQSYCADEDFFEYVCMLLTSAEMFAHVLMSLEKFQKTACTCIAVVKCNVLGNKINAVSLRVVNTTKKINAALSKEIFSGLTANKSIDYADGDDITLGKTTDDGSNLLYNIFDFRHDFNARLSTAEPLFGYKAVELYQKRKIALSWDKILLGEDTKGTPFFTAIGDSKGLDDISIQEKGLHNMMAGSRSGKGVMTMNILASAIVSNKPIFYLDRKPDMAVMFAQMTNGNMFILNGGQYASDNDPQQYFGPEGKMTKGWKEAYDNMPSYLKTSAFPVKELTGNLADYVYFRGILFTMGILMCRAMNAGGNLENLGGSRGVVVIIDEFKNWQITFEKAFFEVMGKFANNIVKGNKEKEYDALVQKIKSTKTTLSMESDEKKQVKLKQDIAKYEEDLQNCVSEYNVYCSTLMNKYEESINKVSELVSAQYKNSEMPLSDIFVIGQNIDIDSYNDGLMYSRTKTDGFNQNSSTKEKSLARTLLHQIPHDWFMGYNQDTDKTKKYMAADTDPTVQKWITQKQYWAYVPDASMETLRTSKPVCRFFKPYLVLNDCREDNPNIGKKEHAPEFTFVAQCRDRVNSASAGLWNQVRIKHLPEEPSTIREEATRISKGSNINYDDPMYHLDQLNPGIGFKGLVEATMATQQGENVKTVFNPLEDLSESKKIADYIAKAMGYNSYFDLLYDFTPKGLFSIPDMINALNNPQNYQVNFQERLPLFVKYGFMNISASVDNEEPKEENSSFDSSKFFNDIDIKDNETQSGSLTVETVIEKPDITDNQIIIQEPKSFSDYVHNASIETNTIPVMNDEQRSITEQYSKDEFIALLKEEAYKEYYKSVEKLTALGYTVDNNFKSETVAKIFEVLRKKYCEG